MERHQDCRKLSPTIRHVGLSFRHKYRNLELEEVYSFLKEEKKIKRHILSVTQAILWADIQTSQDASLNCSRNEAMISSGAHHNLYRTNRLCKEGALLLQQIFFMLINSPTVGCFLCLNHTVGIFLLLLFSTLRAFLCVSEETAAPCIYFHQITSDRAVPQIAQ